MTQIPDRPRGAHTRRDVAKAERRAAILIAAARLIAERGFANVRLEDIGAAVGVSGPAMYRYFPGKQQLLTELLVDVSERLLNGGKAVLRDPPTDPNGLLRQLIRFHVGFAVDEPNLIKVQNSDLASLDLRSRDRVRRLQRLYVGLWTDVLVSALRVTNTEARARALATFGLINSSPRLREISDERTRALLESMASAAAIAR